MTKETKKSDVGLLETNLFQDLEDLKIAIKNDKSYSEITKDIKYKVSNIFDNYLRIGYLLNHVQKQNLYTIGGYKNVFEYAHEEFDLSDTTVKNVMAISSRFCDKEGYLDKKYDKYKYSSLVELISVDDQDINEFQPAMTVKKIREKKNEILINKKLDEILLEKNFLTTLTDTIKNVDLKEILGIDDCKISYKTNKPKKYETEQHSTYICEIDFIITSSYFKKQSEFKIELNFSDYSKLYRFKIDSPYWEWCDFKDLKGLKKLYLEHLNKVKSNHLITTKEEQLQTNFNDTSGHSSFDQILNDKMSFYEKENMSNLFVKFLANKFSNYFYEYDYHGSYEFYKDKKRHKNKNPILFKITNLQDPLISELVTYENGEEKQRIKIFTEIENVLLNKLEDSFKNIPGYNSFPEDDDQTNIYEFIN